MDGASVDSGSVDSGSVDGASVDGASVDGASVDGASVEAQTHRRTDAQTHKRGKDMALARSFRELEVHKLAFDLQQRVFALSERFPREETYSLIDQIRRSSRSVGANIAEAWAKRRYVAHFVSKLSDADGEGNETLHWLATAYACGYLDQEQHRALVQDYERVGAMLGRMIDAPESWCRPH